MSLAQELIVVCPEGIDLIVMLFDLDVDGGKVVLGRSFVIFSMEVYAVLAGQVSQLLLCDAEIFEYLTEGDAIPIVGQPYSYHEAQ